MTDDNPQKAMFGEAMIEDPEDYNRRQRFKEIHDARQRVVESLAQDDEAHGGQLSKVPVDTISRTATNVALYVIELLPLLKQLDEGLGYGKDKLGGRFETESLAHFASAMGLVRTDGDGVRPADIAESMCVFQIANEAYAELGMELDLSDGNKDASFDYSDLLDDDAQPAEPPEIPENHE